MSEYGDHEPTDPTRPLGGSSEPGGWSEPAGWSEQRGSWEPGNAWEQVQPPSSGAAGQEQPTPTYGGAAPSWHWTGAYPPGQQPMSGWPYQQTPPTPPPAPGHRPRPSRRVKVLGTAAALLLVGGAAAGGAAFGFAHSDSTSSAAGIAGGSTPQGTPGQSPQTPQGGGSQQVPHPRGDGRASRFSTPGHASAAQSVGVVDINTRLKYEGARAAGTGMILTSNGEVLTNNHVVEGATKIKVTVVSTGKKYVATVVGTDKVDDVAILQLTGASGLATVRTDTSAATVGEPVTAVGNAMGAGGVPSAAKGTVTGVNRSITTQSEGGVDGERLTGMIEVDAQVVAGDSGGPLYDSTGAVIGMDTAASSSPAQSTGFAIPIARALSIANQIESGQAGGNISLGTPAFLGVQFSSALGQSGNGAVIGGVLRNTPAASAGLIAGDTITGVDGTAITSGTQLHTVLSHYTPGQSASVTWTDTQGGSHTATVRLIAGPAE